MAPVKETTPGPSPLSDIKNLLKELHEKVDRLEAKVEAKASGKEDKKLRMILIGPPGAGTSSSTLSCPTTITQLCWIPFSTHTFCPVGFLLFLSSQSADGRLLVYSGDTYWSRQKQKKGSGFVFLFFGEYFPIFDQISQHSSRRPNISPRKEATIKKQKEVLTFNRKWKKTHQFS